MKRIHGVVSLMLIGMALLLGGATLMQGAPRLGVLYLALMLVGGVLVLWSYCAKCPCRERNCGHVFPGPFTRLLPPRKPGPYTWVDYTLTGLSLGALVLIPQPYLWLQPSRAWAFWGLMLIALVEIYFFVCPRCANPYCPNAKEQTKA